MRRGTWCAWSAWHLLTSSHINFYFLWQAWRLATSTLVLRGRHGTYGSGLDLVAPLVVARGAAVLYVAGVALAHINLCFAWQACHLLTSTFLRRVWHLAKSTLVSLRHFASQAWPWHLLRLTSMLLLRGRRGAWRHRRWFCVAGVVFPDRQSVVVLSVLASTIFDPMWEEVLAWRRSPL